MKNDQKKSRMFGEEMIWLFIFGDLCTFTLFFFYFIYERTNNLAIYLESQSALNVHYGSMNTLILLASSWLVVIAARALRANLNRKAAKALGGAFVFGTIFTVLKLLEYQAKAEAGVSFETNNYFLFYYLLTGLHLTHVVIGLALLAYFGIQFRKSEITELSYTNFSSVAIFWHMVDLLWIIIFTLLYVLP